MATHAIGPGTCNLTVNMPLAMRTMIGRLAMQIDKSSGWLARRLFEMAPKLTSAGDCAKDSAAEDDRAAQIIRAAMADGLSNQDRPALLNAIRHIERSRDRDRAIAEGVAL